MPGPHLQCQKATEAVGHRPQPKGSSTWLTPPTPLTPGIDADTEASAGQPHGTLEHLDPASLQIDNVRGAVDLSKEFLASLRAHGVLVPLTAVRGDDGVVTVRNGQRRTLGARDFDPRFGVE